MDQEKVMVEISEETAVHPSFAKALTVGAAVVFILAVLSLTRVAFGHSWYDQGCCAEKDCHPVPCEDLEEQKNGSWKYLPTNNVFYEDQVHQSRDKFCHVCMQQTDYNDAPYRSICVYIQSGV